MKRLAKRFSVMVSIAAMAFSIPVTAEALPDGLALTPPMGFNNWNTTGCKIDEKMIRDMADIFVDKGLKAAGYSYVNVDDCWAEPQRDAEGKLEGNKLTFPSGMKALGDYIHSKGLKFGIYTSAGTVTCAKTMPGGLDHEDVDARTFADWGVDYLKYDNCNNQGRPALERYTKMRDALKKTGRAIVYSLCEWGENKPWEWGKDVGHLWRTTGDIKDNWSSMLNIVKKNAPLAPFGGPGHWNDPDMLEIGNGGMSTLEYESHMSLWSIMAAPLLIGSDLRKVSKENFEVLLNQEVIAIDQDAKGVQGTVLSQKDGHWVFSKPLANGDVAVALFNENTTSATVGTDVSALGLPRSLGYSVRDLWKHKTYQSAGQVSALVPPHGTALFRIKTSRDWFLDEPLVGAGLEFASTVTGVPGDLVPAGKPFEATVSVTNHARVPVLSPKASLTAPAGWKIDQISRPRKWILGAEESAVARWRITPPAGSEGTVTALRSETRYDTLGFGQLTRAVDTPVTVPAAPPAGAAYASDLRWYAEKNGYGNVERDMSNGGIPDKDGKPLTINGVRYAKGLGAHAPSELVFHAGGRCTTFSADVGIDDEKEPANPRGSATFEVHSDGEKTAGSGLLTHLDPAAHLTADVTGAEFVKLVVTDGGDGNSYDRGDWAAAQFTCR